MTPVPVLGTITIDSLDAVALAGWYARILEGTVDSFAEVGIHVVRARALRGMNLAIAGAESPTPGKNRLHLDFGSPRRPATVARLVEQGARLVDEHEYGAQGWSVLADPDGNLFCVSDEADGEGGRSG